MRRMEFARDADAIDGLNSRMVNSELEAEPVVQSTSAPPSGLPSTRCHIKKCERGPLSSGR